MAFDTLVNLQDPTKYKTAIKEELGRVAAQPVKFQYFEKFTFKDKKTGPILLVGENAIKLVTPVTKSGAVCKAAGLCALNSETKKVEFAAAQGSVALALLKAALNGTGKDGVVDSVKKLSVLAGEKEGAADAAKGPSPMLPRAETRFAAVTKVFDSIKAKFDDEQRKTLRVDLGIAQEKIEKGDSQSLKEAIQTLDKLELKIKAVAVENEKSLALEKAVAQDKIASAKRSLDSIEAEVKRVQERLKTQEGEAAGLKTLPPKTKPADWIRKRDNKAKEVEATKVTLATKQAELEKLLASYAANKGENQAALERAKKMHAEIAESIAIANKVGKEMDPLMAKVGEMADAGEFQKKNIKEAENDPDVHGTGRHSAQTGMDQQARRAATTKGVTPDQTGNKAGVSQVIKEWNQIKITYETGADGKKTIKNKAVLLKHVVDNFKKGPKTSTASMFANPVLEKEAVDKAIAIMEKDNWEEIMEGAAWVDLVKVEIAVPKPAKYKGYGYSIKHIDGAAKKTAAEAQAVVTRFENGELSMDEMLAGLDVQLKQDPTGVVEMIPHAVVRLARSDKSAKWKSITHFPDEREAGPRWDIAGKKVRKGTKVVDSLPNLA